MTVLCNHAAYPQVQSCLMINVIDILLTLFGSL